MMNYPRFGKFDSYACFGEARSVVVGQFTVRAVIEHDQDSSPDEYDCYSDEDKARWRNDDWHFCGIVLHVSCGGVVIDDHAASLWGIELNLLDQNDYLSDVADELLPDAIESAKRTAKALVDLLKKEVEA